MNGLLCVPGLRSIWLQTSKCHDQKCPLNRKIFRVFSAWLFTNMMQMFCIELFQADMPVAMGAEGNGFKTGHVNINTTGPTHVYIISEKDYGNVTLAKRVNPRDNTGGTRPPPPPLLLPPDLQNNSYYNGSNIERPSFIKDITPGYNTAIGAVSLFKDDVPQLLALLLCPCKWRKSEALASVL